MNLLQIKLLLLAALLLLVLSSLVMLLSSTEMRGYEAHQGLIAHLHVLQNQTKSTSNDDSVTACSRDVYAATEKF